jgi:hypothetical protein
MQPLHELLMAELARQHQRDLMRDGAQSRVERTPQPPRRRARPRLRSLLPIAALRGRA